MLHKLYKCAILDMSLGGSNKCDNRKGEIIMATVLTAVNVSVANQEEALLVSKETREQHLSRTEVLGRVGRVLTALPGADIATTRQVAEFYGVDVDAIESVVKRNSDELILNGMTKIKGKEIKELVSVNMTETKAQVVNKEEIEKYNTEFDSTLKITHKNIGVSPNGAVTFTKRAIG